MIKLRQKRGFLLVTTFMVGGVLLVLSGAYITGALSESNLVQRKLAFTKAFYVAEQGLEYAYTEARNHNWSWSTHQVDGADSNSNGENNDLITAVSPTITLGIVNGNPTFANFAANGVYSINNNSLGTIEVKTYPDPNHPLETLVLSRANVGAASHILKFRLARRSLFQYFYYYPGDKNFLGMNFDGKDTGGIYARGNIRIGGTTFTDITELSTNKTGTISIFRETYSAPYQLDAKRLIGETNGQRDGRAPLPSLGDADTNGEDNIYSNDLQYPWQNWKWPPRYFPPLDWLSINTHMVRATYFTKVNGVEIPQKFSDISGLSGTTWDWDKYEGTDKASLSSEPDVQFFDANGNLADNTYWDALTLKYGAGYFDPAFWSEKKYKRDSETVTVDYVNTIALDGDQSKINAWKSYLEDNELDTIIHEKNTGGYNTDIPNIQTYYSTLAKEDGFYFGNDGIWLNGGSPSSLPCWVSDNVEFFNTVRAKDRTGDGTADRENVLDFDILGQVECQGELPNNGIIYVADKSLRLKRASKLQRGLTIISPYNVYIKGSFNNYNNDESWQPAAIISNSWVYFLSSNFNDPQDLPATIYPREYPYELQYVDLDNFIPGDRDKLERLEADCENFFGLDSSFNISSPGHQLANTDELVSEIRSVYQTQYANSMPNYASDTEVYAAIASPYDISDTQYNTTNVNMLERWQTASGNPVKLKIMGAFTKLPGSWAAVSDAPGVYHRPRAGITNCADPTKCPDPMVHYTGEGTSIFVTRKFKSCDENATVGNPCFEYEDRFGNANNWPPGGFFAGSQERWEQSTDFDHHIA